MRRPARLVTAGSIALLGITVLAGCSSSSSTDSASAAASAAASAEAGAQLPAPIIVEVPATTQTDAKVGNFIDIVVKQVAGTTIDTSTPDLLEITQGGEKDGAVFNPGAKAIKAGTGKITITYPDSTTSELTVNITE